ncbi:TonB-dependent receptor [Lichenicoccus sp.]|uniref:TonB-dependent receptor n=1 Tax=Lichenicoccus sp. TaxID=2781899 RepID=UPI003D14F2DF
MTAAATARPVYAQSAPSQGGTSSGPGVPASNAGDTSAGQEIVVTAEKRTQTELNVPIAITAITGADLTSHEQTHFEDYADTIPGVQVTDTGLIGSQLIIRGLSSGSASTSPSAAIYIDDTPYSVEGPLAGSFGAAPNLDTYDLQRVEVLKGPQGTLYGADALGGLLKYVTNAPDPSKFEGSLLVGASGVYNGNTPGGDVHGMVNIPLADNLALRLVGYDTYAPGFIDNDYLHETGINDTQTYGGRASLLWEPLSNLTVRLSGLVQNRQYGDFSSEYVNGATGRPYPTATSACSSAVACPAGPLVLNNYIDQPGHTLNAVASLNVRWDAGPFTVTSTSSYARFVTSGIWDYTGPLGATTTSALNTQLATPGTYGIGVNDYRAANMYTQELRLASPEWQKVAWQFGGYFNHESSILEQLGFPISAATNQGLTSFLPPDNLLTENAPTTYAEYAGFGDIDYHILPTFDISAGGRYSAIHGTVVENAYGPFGAGQSIPFTTTNERVATFSLEASWHFTPRNMFYTRVASGFSPGGPNERSPTATFLPSTYAAETTVDYEAGLKGRLFGNHLTYQVDAFDIDWHTIQSSVIIDGFASIASVGDAHSRGFEWDLAYVPRHGLTFKWDGDYTYASLASVTPEGVSVGAQQGDILPLVPRWQTSGSVQYEQPVSADWSGFGSAAVRFNGDRLGDFHPGIFRTPLPAFTMIDFQLGMENKKYSVTLYCKNCSNVITPTDDLTWNSSSNGTGLQNAAVFTPRTVGVELSSRF